MFPGFKVCFQIQLVHLHHGAGIARNAAESGAALSGADEAGLYNLHSPDP